MDEGKFGELSTRDIVIGMAKDLEHLTEDFNDVKDTVYKTHPKEHKVLEKRVHDIELKDAKGEGSEKKGSENLALAISVIAITISSLLALAAFIFGG